MGYAPHSGRGWHKSTFSFRVRDFDFVDVCSVRSLRPHGTHGHGGAAGTEGKKERETQLLAFACECVRSYFMRYHPHFTVNYNATTKLGKPRISVRT